MKIVEYQHNMYIILETALGLHGMKIEVAGSIPIMGASHFSVLSDMMAIFQVK